MFLILDQEVIFTKRLIFKNFLIISKIEIISTQLEIKKPM